MERSAKRYLFMPDAVPENAALGTYECRSVEGLTGERNWAPIFEDPPSTSAWFNDHSTPKVGESSSGSSQPRGR
jgi:hypothetical protein